MDSYRILDFIIGIMVFILLLTLFVSCSHRDIPSDDCCKADFVAGVDYEFQVKNAWKKEF